MIFSHTFFGDTSCLLEVITSLITKYIATNTWKVRSGIHMVLNLTMVPSRILKARRIATKTGMILLIHSATRSPTELAWFAIFTRRSAWFPSMSNAFPMIIARMIS